MTAADLVLRYENILINLATDLVVILVMTYVLYFRRHWRADLLLSYIALNVGIFVTMSVLTQVKVDIATGFGLFAILSIIRLRSSAVTQQEVAYYFLALVVGLVNGLGVADRALVFGLNFVLLVIMFVFDSSPLRTRSHRVDVKLDGVFTNGPALVAELERQLGVRVIYFEIMEIDLLRNNMLVDARVRPTTGVITPPHEKKRKKEADDSHPGDDVPSSPDPHPPVPVGPPTGASYVGRPGGAVYPGGSGRRVDPGEFGTAPRYGGARRGSRHGG